MMKNENIGCDYCLNDEPLYWADFDNNSFIDSKGEVTVYVKGIMIMRYNVKYCPNCGKKFEI